MSPRGALRCCCWKALEKGRPQGIAPHHRKATLCVHVGQSLQAGNSPRQVLAATLPPEEPERVGPAHGPTGPQAHRLSESSSTQDRTRKRRRDSQEQAWGAGQRRGKEALSLTMENEMWFEEKLVDLDTRRTHSLHRYTLLKVARWIEGCLQGDLGRLKPRVLMTVINLSLKSSLWKSSPSLTTPSPPSPSLPPDNQRPPSRR